MNTKWLILVVILSLLVTVSVYGSNVSHVGALKKTDLGCKDFTDKGGNTYTLCCYLEGNDLHCSKCTGTDGSCEIKTKGTNDTSADTKVPKSGLLNDGGLLKGQGDNQTTSQRIVDPEDRFCVQGTGGKTGSPCVPCNPGKVNCIDVVTGGLLDTPDTATSESEEQDDTNPKDLDGSNNDDNGPQLNPGD